LTTNPRLGGLFKSVDPHTTSSLAVGGYKPLPYGLMPPPKNVPPVSLRPTYGTPIYPSTTQQPPSFPPMYKMIIITIFFFLITQKLFYFIFFTLVAPRDLNNLFPTFQQIPKLFVVFYVLFIPFVKRFKKQRKMNIEIILIQV
jgi:hypothetical protein